MSTLNQDTIRLSGLLMEADIFVGDDEEKAEQALEFIRKVTTDFNLEGLELSYPRSDTRVYVSYTTRRGNPVLNGVEAYPLSIFKGDFSRLEKLDQLNRDMDVVVLAGLEQAKSQR